MLARATCGQNGQHGLENELARLVIRLRRDHLCQLLAYQLLDRQRAGLTLNRVQHQCHYLLGLVHVGRLEAQLPLSLVKSPVQAPVCLNRLLKLAQMSLECRVKIVGRPRIYHVIYRVLHLQHDLTDVVQSHVQHLSVLVCVKKGLVLFNDVARLRVVNARACSIEQV